MMKAIFDISVLGMGMNLPRARTGIFRATEGLANALAKTGAIEAFSSSLGVRNYFECQDYLHSNQALKTVPLLSPELTRLVSIGSLEKLHYSQTKGERRTLTQKIAGRLLAHQVTRRALVRNNFHAADLSGANVFHSSFYPFPAQVREQSKCRKVITVYDLIPLLYPRFFKYKEGALIRGVIESIDQDTWVTCISETTKNDLCNYVPQLDRNKVFVVPLAASSLFYPCHDLVELERVKRKFGLLDGEYILSLSTLEPRKNIAQTIRSFTRMVEQEGIKSLKLVLVGAKGWAFDNIFEEINTSKRVREQIVITGFVPDDDLAALYSGAMMFVYPSFYEGFGLPPLEAMQCGVPVITSNTSSLPEVVGDAGIMVSPDDGDAISQAMLHLYKSKELRQQLRAKSLVQAGLFSWKRCAEQTIDVYKLALATENSWGLTR